MKELTREKAKEIDKIIEEYSKDGDEKKLKKKLELYRYEDGTLSLYIREELLKVSL